MSDIRVSVQWKSSSVFAGEDVECIITFRNVSPGHRTSNSHPPNSRPRGISSGRERWKESLPQQRGQKSVGHTRNNSVSNAGSHHLAISRSHKPALSLSTPHDSRQTSAINLKSSNTSDANGGHGGKHRKSVSIVSLGGDPSISEWNSEGQVSTSKRTDRSHARAASLQGLPWRSSTGKLGPTPGIFGVRIALFCD